MIELLFFFKLLLTAMLLCGWARHHELASAAIPAQTRIIKRAWNRMGRCVRVRSRMVARRR